MEDNILNIMDLKNDVEIENKIYTYLIKNEYKKDSPNIINSDFIFYDQCIDYLNSYINKHKGFIYIAHDNITSYYKVGMTRDYNKRFKSLNSAGIMLPLSMIEIIPVNDIGIETQIHQDLIFIGNNKFNFKIKEFFNLSLTLIENVIAENVSKHDNLLKKYFLI